MTAAKPVLEDTSLITPLEEHSTRLKHTTLKALFNENPNRFANFAVECGDLTFDFSKNIIDDSALTSLVALTKAANLDTAIKDIFTGKKVNNTEKRAALHSALRAPAPEQPDELKPVISNAFEQLKKIADKISTGHWKGFSGQNIKDVVNIGIGGSDLGPAMTVTALEAYHCNPAINYHFVSNIDPTNITRVLKDCAPESTLFIVASKTFTTLETLSNARAAKDWVLKHYSGETAAIKDHFVAISTAIDKVQEFGIDTHNILPMWDWVGGRYSIWSTIALPLCAAIGWNNFQRFLAGAYKTDKHFRTAEPHQNAPVLMALLSVWYSEFFGCDSHAVICYEHYLKEFPNYLQQLDMESNGKSVTKEGTAVQFKTGIPVWGNIGSNSQHSFHQLFHQGTSVIPVDFIVGTESCNPVNNQHRDLFSNCLAQSQAMMLGKTKEDIIRELAISGKTSEEIADLAAHKVIPGNKPSTTIVYKKLSPEVLGQLIAIYEHKIFVQSVIWGINPFDQWGVELGKALSSVISKAIESDENKIGLDPSTLGLIEIYQNNKP